MTAPLASSGLQTASNERLWSILIERIANGDVVPVLGSGMLRCADPENPGREICFFQMLAERVAAKWGVAVDSQATNGRQVLHDVVMAHYQAGHQSVGNLGQMNIEAAYREIAQEAENLEFPVPETIRQLAKIGGFRTYLTTLFDDRLDQALEENGRIPRKGTFRPVFAAKTVPSDAKLRSLNLSTDLSRGILDGEADPETGEACQVYHLLGSSTVGSANSFVIWDNDLLNWAMAIDESCPDELKSCLQNKYLLYIGLECGYWLTRFLLRIANHGPLEYEGTPNYFTQEGLTRNTLMVQFFESLGPGRVSTLDLGEGGMEWFVTELSRRWGQHLAQSSRAPVLPANTRFSLPENHPPKRKFIFISYSRQDDLEVAKQIKGELDKLNIDAWFDLKETPFGENWRAKMEDGIKRCHFFLAIISKEALARRKTYYFEEWNLAQQESMQIGQDSTYCLRVLIDDVDSSHSKIPKSLKKGTHWRSGRSGPWDSLANEIKRLWDAE